jgi:nucleotide-binding universal stress UspA family protein
LIVLHVAEPPVVGYEGTMTPPAEGDWMALKERLRRIRAPDAKIPIKRRLEEGDPAAEILRVAAESDCDVIMMGTHGRTWMARVLMGSVAEQVVRRATCPVLVVKTPLPKSPAT